VRTLALLGFVYGAGLRAICAQTTANVEAGLSTVRYDGFLASGAGSISPAIRWEQPQGRGFLSARGTYLRFESGRHSLDASANAAWFVPLARSWRGELGLTGGASQYANIASFSHADAEVRLHLMDRARGGWIGVTLGQSSFGAIARPATVVAGGLWLVRDNLTMIASLDRSFVGDTVYTDVRSSARWYGPRLIVEGVLGARVWSRGGGRGIFGEGSAILPLGALTALVFSGGRYPTDVVSGSIAGRYLTIAMRIGTQTSRRRVTPTLQIKDPADATGSPRLAIQVRQLDVLLTVYAPGARQVEVSGDFTDWQPAQLTRDSLDHAAWHGTFRIAGGVHRINVRRDGGPWTVPDGTMRSADDYDGEVGVFVLP
jgi:hypothetical protein